MREPVLVIMAAGMGSRFGGLKQITPVDDQGHSIIDYSLYDAWKAGFRKVVFIIKHAIEEDFKNAVGTRMEQFFDVRYVFQEVDKLPEGFSVPEGRIKPWGTAHAIACARRHTGGAGRNALLSLAACRNAQLRAGKHHRPRSRRPPRHRGKDRE